MIVEYHNVYLMYLETQYYLKATEIHNKIRDEN